MHHLIHHSYADGTPYSIENCLIFKAFLEGERIHVDNEVLWRADGTCFHAEYWSYPIYRDEQVSGAVVTFLDITERKLAEETLKESEDKYRTLIENLPQKIFLKDRQLVYVSCNENYAGDLGITVEEIRGRTDYDFYPKELAEKYRTDDEHLMEQGRTEEFEERYMQQGNEVWVHTVKTPIWNDDGNVAGVLGIFWDVTEKRQLEEQLIQ